VIMNPVDPGPLTVAERTAIGLRVALLHREASVVEHLTARLAATGPAGLAEVVRDPERWRELPPRVHALLNHADQVAVEPADSGREEIGVLQDHGLSSREIVAASQVISYVSYECRLLRGAALLAAASS
jgi:uncharacterized protein YciW